MKVFVSCPYCGTLNKTRRGWRRGVSGKCSHCRKRFVRPS